MSPNEVAALTTFVAAIPRPVERLLPGFTSGDLLRGEKTFNSIGCVTCHVADLPPTSGMFSDLLLHDMGSELQSPFPAPVGDLQGVHRMRAVQLDTNRFRSSALAPGYYGSQEQSSPPRAYAINRPDQAQFPRGELSNEEIEGSARLTWDALQREWRTPPLWGVADTAPYLHDGRAETLQEAILMHGGEAQVSRDAFAELTESKQRQLVTFLTSLQAPKTMLD